MKKSVKVGDTIKLLIIKKYEMIRDNDRSESTVKEIFLHNNRVNVINKSSKYIDIACYDGESCPNDNYYVIRLYDGIFDITMHRENNQRGAIYYKGDYFGYVGEDENFVYVAHYSIYEYKTEAMRKIKKDEYYKNAISINEFNVADEWYDPEWGLIGKEIK